MSLDAVGIITSVLIIGLIIFLLTDAGETAFSAAIINAIPDGVSLGSAGYIAAAILVLGIGGVAAYKYVI